MLDTPVQAVDTFTISPPPLPTSPTPTPPTNTVRTTNNVGDQTLSLTNVDVQALLNNYSTILASVTSNIQTITQLVLNANIN